MTNGNPFNNKVEGQTFVGATIQIDGGVIYADCKFVKCNLVITGVAPVQVVNTAFENCGWSFAGPAANVLSFLKATYQSGGKEMVEAVIREIAGKAGEIPNLNPALKSGGRIQ